MARGVRSFESHDFYCINCGNKGIPCQRRKGHQHSKGHLKKLWCIYCQKEVNHYECRTLEDVEKFKRKFAKGEWNCGEQSIVADVRTCRSW